MKAGIVVETAVGVGVAIEHVAVGLDESGGEIKHRAGARTRVLRTAKDHAVVGDADPNSLVYRPARSPSKTVWLDPSVMSAKRIRLLRNIMPFPFPLLLMPVVVSVISLPTQAA